MERTSRMKPRTIASRPDISMTTIRKISRYIGGQWLRVACTAPGPAGEDPTRDGADFRAPCIAGGAFRVTRLVGCPAVNYPPPAGNFPTQSVDCTLPA